MVKGRKEKKNRERFTFYSYGLLYASRLYKCTIAIIINETCKYIYSATNNFRVCRVRVVIAVFLSGHVSFRVISRAACVLHVAYVYTIHPLIHVPNSSIIIIIIVIVIFIVTIIIIIIVIIIFPSYPNNRAD